MIRNRRPTRRPKERDELGETKSKAKHKKLFLLGIFATKQSTNAKNEKLFLPSSRSSIETRVIYNNEAVKFKACTYRWFIHDFYCVFWLKYLLLCERILSSRARSGSPWWKKIWLDVMDGWLRKTNSPRKHAGIERKKEFVAFVGMPSRDVWKCYRHQLDFSMSEWHMPGEQWNKSFLLWSQVRCQSHLYEFNWWDLFYC